MGKETLEHVVFSSRDTALVNARVFLDINRVAIGVNQTYSVRDFNMFSLFKEAKPFD